MDDDKIIEQIKRLGVLEEQLKTMRGLMERAWFALEPGSGREAERTAEERLEDLLPVMRQLDTLIPYPNREDSFLGAAQSARTMPASRMNRYEQPSYTLGERGR